MKILEFFRRNFMGNEKPEKRKVDKPTQSENLDFQTMKLTKNNYTKLLESPIPESDQFKIVKFYIKAGEYFKQRGNAETNIRNAKES